MTMQQDRIDLREAAQRLGVHYMTAYRYVRMGRLPATQDGGRWVVDPKDLKALRPGRASASRRGDARPESYRERLRARLLAGDEPGAWQVVESFLVSGGTPKAALLDVLAPVMREVGAGWESAEFSVGDEHRATAVAIRVVGRLGPMFARRGRPRGTVVVACAPGDSHALPAAMVTCILRGEGYSIVELGGATPVGDVVAEAEAAGDRLRGVVISVSSQAMLAAAGEAAAAVRAAVPDTTVLVGGPAVASAEDATALGSDGWSADAAGVAMLLDTLGRSAG
ncbi:MAG TPA: B12-binding domain-containing protein [Jiangellaceae bacterium]|nr:B12-binding domain-containing protein [Jiangellaceae bacterium]